MILATIDDKDIESLYSATVVWGVIILVPAMIMLVIANKEDKKFGSLLQFYSMPSCIEGSSRSNILPVRRDNRLHT